MWLLIWQRWARKLQNLFCFMLKGIIQSQVKFKIIQNSGCKIQTSEKRKRYIKDKIKVDASQIPAKIFKTTSLRPSVNLALPLKFERSVPEVYVPYKTTTENPLYRFYPPKIDNPDLIQFVPRNRSSEKCTVTFLKNSIIFVFIKLFLNIHFNLIY